jgi:putative multiple sugar transport system ATP-binding protein
MADPILEMRGIKKSFHGVRALSNVNLTVQAGEIHAIVGENGAGKSTLMKVLSGVYAHGDFEGQIRFQGQDCHFKGIADSEHKGIIIIHQELALVPLLSIAENIFLGNEQATRGVINWTTSFVKTQALLKKVGLKESPNALITNLGVGKQQLIEIAKALSKEVKLLILDEPTASLNETDSDALLELLLDLKRHGITCILISHKLNEISKVADSITVLRDGATVATLDCREHKISEDTVIRHMVGREMADRYPKRTPYRHPQGRPKDDGTPSGGQAEPGLGANSGDKVFEVKNWQVHHEVHPERVVIKGVDLHVNRGEIVGIAGLMGAGRTELAMSIFGKTYGKGISGEVFLHGKKVDTGTVQKAINNRIAYVTEDRKGYGLVLDETIAWNTTLANLNAVSTNSVIDEGREFKVAEDYRKKLNIRSPDVFARTVNLSGGNQQKVVLSKWLFSDPEVLILDEPTRGIDVGAKYEIYTIIAQLAAEGKCVLMISSEMPELLGMCDRICVLNEGRFVAEFTAAEATQEKIMRSIVTSGVN